MTQIESNHLLMRYIKYLFRIASREFGNNPPLSKKGHSKGSHYWSCSYQLLFQRQPCHREYMFFHSMIYTFLWGEWLSCWKFLNTGKIAYTFPNNDISIQNRKLIKNHVCQSTQLNASARCICNFVVMFAFQPLITISHCVGWWAVTRATGFSKLTICRYRWRQYSWIC